MVINPRTDPIPLTVSLLSTNWDEANTGGVGSKPAIFDDRTGRKGRRRPNGIVAVYHPPRYTRKRNDGEGKFKTHKKVVTIKLRAATSAKLVQLSGEVERIYGVVLIKPDTFWNWIEDLGETARREYKGVADADVLWEFWANSVPQAT